jgi:integrase/recombinase XerD
VGELWSVPSGRPYELLEDWVLWMQARGLAERTVQERWQIVNRVAQGATVSPDGLTSREIQRYLARPDIGQSTRANYHVALTAWFKWLVEQEHRPDNPMVKIPRPRVPRRRPRPMATEHLERLLASPMHRRTRMMILLATYQGLRAHEIAKIRGEDVDLLGERLYVKGKGGVDEWLPLHARVAAEAQGYPRKGYWFQTHVGNARGARGPILARSVSTIISQAAARAGAMGTAHNIRHWYGTELNRAGVPILTLRSLMRHASAATTQIYAEIDEDQRTEGIGRLPDLDGAT